MNTETGELFRIKDDAELKELKRAFGDALVPVPDELEGEANTELKGKDKAFVNFHRITPLTQWVKNQRADNKKKQKQKMAKASKKRNR